MPRAAQPVFAKRLKYPLGDGVSLHRRSVITAWDGDHGGGPLRAVGP